MRGYLVWLFSLAGSLALTTVAFAESPTGWARHVIDASSRGADGIKLGDLDGDGRLDLVTGWEEGGQVRVYLQPPKDRIREPWPAVTVGRVNSPEDACFFDVNGDGRLDVISCCEGNEQTVFVHLAPRQVDQFLVADAWKTISLRESMRATRWMYAVPFPLTPDFRERETRIVCGSKNPGGRLGYFDFSVSVEIAEARWREIGPAGWIMSLEWGDVDGDGRLDLLYSDRMGPHRGCWCRLNPGNGTPLEHWPEFPIGGQEREVMFLSTAEIVRKGRLDVLCAVKGAGGLVLLNESKPGVPHFRVREIPRPAETGTGKCLVAGDMDGDGCLDLVVSCEQAEGKHGVYWLRGPVWEQSEAAPLQAISGRDQGVKYDLLVLLDLDGDGDLDTLTCEERDQLGVIWYENPANKAAEGR